MRAQGSVVAAAIVLPLLIAAVATAVLKWHQMVSVEEFVQTSKSRVAHVAEMLNQSTLRARDSATVLVQTMNGELILRRVEPGEVLTLPQWEQGWVLEGPAAEPLQHLNTSYISAINISTLNNCVELANFLARSNAGFRGSLVVKPSVRVLLNSSVSCDTGMECYGMGGETYWVECRLDEVSTMRITANTMFEVRIGENISTTSPCGSGSAWIYLDKLVVLQQPQGGVCGYIVGELHWIDEYIAGSGFECSCPPNNYEYYSMDRSAPIVYSVPCNTCIYGVCFTESGVEVANTTVRMVSMGDYLVLSINSSNKLIVVNISSGGPLAFYYQPPVYGYYGYCAAGSQVLVYPIHPGEEYNITIINPPLPRP